MDKPLIDSVIRKRVLRILKILDKDFGVKGDFYIGGNSLNRQNTFADIDIFPITTLEISTGQKISVTKNADTYQQDNHILQVCKYHKENLEELVESFDFAHIRVGAEIRNNKIVKIYFTEDYANAHIIGDTWFLKSEYPLSSLVRAGKYYKKAQISRGQQIRSVLTALIAVIKRGFTDYDDFKDQLDAVDLGLIPEEMDELTRCDLMELFDLLKK